MAAAEPGFRAITVTLLVKADSDQVALDAVHSRLDTVLAEWSQEHTPPTPPHPQGALLLAIISAAPFERVPEKTRKFTTPVLSLQLKPNPGVHVDDALAEGYRVATMLGVVVDVIHNDRSFSCYPTQKGPS